MKTRTKLILAATFLSILGLRLQPKPIPHGSSETISESDRSKAHAPRAVEPKSVVSPIQEDREPASEDPNHPQPPADELLATYGNLNRKDLMSTLEREWMNRHRRNSRSAIAVLEVLSRSTDDVQRENAVAYLRDTLESAERISPELYQAVGEFLLAEPFAPSASASERRAKGADKGEIAMGFASRYPAEFQVLVQRNQNTANAIIFQNARRVAAMNYRESLRVLL